MNLNDYQRLARETAVYPNVGSNLTYAVLGLVGEAGEIANKLKKVQRDDGGSLTEDRRHQLADELGDVLWYVAAVAWELGLSLNTVAVLNWNKLSRRQAVGTLHGEERGDES